MTATDSNTWTFDVTFDSEVWATLTPEERTAWINRAEDALNQECRVTSSMASHDHDWADGFCQHSTCNARTPEQVSEDWRDDQENVQDAARVEVAWTAYDHNGVVTFESDMTITGEQAVGMFQGIGEASL